MTASVIDIADYRRRKSEAPTRANPAPDIELLTFWPTFYAFGWFVVPVMMPISIGVPARF